MSLRNEAEGHARQALAIREQLSSPDMWKTLGILEDIATARGDTAAADEYRRRKEAARDEAERRAGPRGLPQQTVIGLLQLALTARGQKLNLADALAGAGIENPVELLAAIQQSAPWLATHLNALATGAPRPDIDVPPQFAALIQGAWEAASE